MKRQADKHKLAFLFIFLQFSAVSEASNKYYSIKPPDRGPTQNFCYKLTHKILIYEKFCIGPWVVRYLNNYMKFQKMTAKKKKKKKIMFSDYLLAFPWQHSTQY